MTEAARCDVDRIRVVGHAAAAAGEERLTRTSGRTPRGARFARLWPPALWLIGDSIEHHERRRGRWVG